MNEEIEVTKIDLASPYILGIIVGIISALVLGSLWGVLMAEAGNSWLAILTFACGFLVAYAVRRVMVGKNGCLCF